MQMKAIGDALAAAGYAASIRLWIAVEERAAAKGKRSPEGKTAFEQARALETAVDLFHDQNPDIADTRVAVIADLADTASIVETRKAEIAAHRATYANEDFDRAQALAREYTDADRAAGRPAPDAGYSAANYRRAQRDLKKA